VLKLNISCQLRIKHHRHALPLHKHYIYVCMCAYIYIYILSPSPDPCPCFGARDCRVVGGVHPGTPNMGGSDLGSVKSLNGILGMAGGMGGVNTAVNGMPAHLQRGASSMSNASDIKRESVRGSLPGTPSLSVPQTPNGMNM
jgi:hypothetical protein